jgi:hypothetical protein
MVRKGAFVVLDLERTTGAWIASGCRNLADSVPVRCTVVVLCHNISLPLPCNRAQRPCTSHHALALVFTALHCATRAASHPATLHTIRGQGAGMEHTEP